MPRFTRIQKIIIAVIAVFMVFGFITRSMQNGNMISKFGYDAFTMLRYSLIESPVETVKNWGSDFSDLWEAKLENDELKHEMSKQKLYNVELQEQKRQNAELKKLLKMNHSITDYGKIGASVVRRDADMWNNLLTINAGSKDGVKQNMAVVSSKGVIGTVKDVFKHTSTVKLLTTESPGENMSVKVSVDDKTSVEGILEYYDAESERFIVTVLSNSKEIKKNMNVITSGLGGKYPGGLYIGKVTKVEEMDNKIGKKLYVKPGADFKNFEYVSVIDYSEDAT